MKLEERIQTNLNEINKNIDECEIAEGVDPFSIPADDSRVSYITEVGNPVIWDKSNECRKAIQNTDVLITELKYMRFDAFTVIKNKYKKYTQEQKFIKSRNICKMDIDKIINDTKDAEKIKKSCNIIKIINETLPNLKKFKETEVCPIVNNNALSLHYEANRRNWINYDNDPDHLTGINVRKIEDICIDFPLQKDFPYYNEKGKHLLTVRFKINKKPDSGGRVGELQIMTPIGTVIGSESCIWAQRSSSAGKVAKKYEKIDIDWNNPDDVQKMIKNEYETLEGIEGNILDDFPRQTLFSHGVMSYGGWVESGFDPLQFPESTLTQIYRHINKIAPEIIVNNFKKMVKNQVNNNEYEWVKSGRSRIWLDRYNTLLTIEDIIELLDIGKGQFKAENFMKINVLMKRIAHHSDSEQIKKKLNIDEVTIRYYEFYDSINTNMICEIIEEHVIKGEQKYITGYYFDDHTKDEIIKEFKFNTSTMDRIYSIIEGWTDSDILNPILYRIMMKNAYFDFEVLSHKALVKKTMKPQLIISNSFDYGREEEVKGIISHIDYHVLLEYIDKDIAKEMSEYDIRDIIEDKITDNYGRYILFEGEIDGYLYIPLDIIEKFVNDLYNDLTTVNIYEENEELSKDMNKDYEKVMKIIKKEEEYQLKWLKDENEG